MLNPARTEFNGEVIFKDLFVGEKVQLGIKGDPNIGIRVTKRVSTLPMFSSKCS